MAIQRHPRSLILTPIESRAVEAAFKKPRFLGFLKNLKKTKSPNFRFFRFFVSKNSNSFLNQILKVQKLELNNLNHIEFNHTLMTLFSQSICL